MEFDRMMQLAGAIVYSEEMLEEGMSSKMVQMGVMTGETDDLKTTGKVVYLKNNAPQVQALIDVLGIPGDGTAFRTGFSGFACYYEDRGLLFFAKYKRDLPVYIDTMKKKK